MAWDLAEAGMKSFCRDCQLASREESLMGMIQLEESISKILKEPGGSGGDDNMYKTLKPLAPESALSPAATGCGP
jgi:hypothetical protein